MIDAPSETARSSLRIEGGGYRRDHLHAFVQRVEVADDEVRIMGKRSNLLQSLVASSSEESAAFAVRSSVLKWRTRHDSNVRPLPSEGLLVAPPKLRRSAKKCDIVLLLKKNL